MLCEKQDSEATIPSKIYTWAELEEDLQRTYCSSGAFNNSWWWPSKWLCARATWAWDCQRLYDLWGSSQYLSWCSRENPEQRKRGWYKDSFQGHAFAPWTWSKMSDLHSCFWTTLYHTWQWCRMDIAGFLMALIKAEDQAEREMKLLVSGKLTYEIVNNAVNSMDTWVW